MATVPQLKQKLDEIDKLPNRNIKISKMDLVDWFALRPELKNTKYYTIKRMEEHALFEVYLRLHKYNETWEKACVDQTEIYKMYLRDPIIGSLAQIRINQYNAEIKRLSQENEGTYTGIPPVPEPAEIPENRIPVNIRIHIPDKTPIKYHSSKEEETREEKDEDSE